MDQHKGVPRLSLKHFAGPDGRVWTYDKVRGKRWAAKPERTGVEAHYYSVELADGSMDTGLEQLIALLEGEAAPIYEKLAAGQMPKGSDRETFGLFLGLMFVRSPFMRRMAANVHKFGIETHMAFTAQHKDAFQSLLKRMEEGGVDVSDPEFIRELDCELLTVDRRDGAIAESWMRYRISCGVATRRNCLKRGGLLRHRLGR